MVQMTDKVVCCCCSLRRPLWLMQSRATLWRRPAPPTSSQSPIVSTLTEVTSTTLNSCRQRVRPAHGEYRHKAGWSCRQSPPNDPAKATESSPSSRSSPLHPPTVQIRRFILAYLVNSFVVHRSSPTEVNAVEHKSIWRRPLSESLSSFSPPSSFQPPLANPFLFPSLPASPTIPLYRRPTF